MRGLNRYGNCRHISDAIGEHCNNGPGLPMDAFPLIAGNATDQEAEAIIFRAAEAIKAERKAAGHSRPNRPMLLWWNHERIAA